MSDLYVDLGTGNQPAQQAVDPVKRRIQQGRDHRKQFEPVWHSNLAFAAGKHWLEWDRFNRTLTLPQELRNKELYSADVITEYRTTALGELGSDDDRPELLLRRDDLPSENYQHQLNKAIGYGWDHEWDGDEALAEIDRLIVDLGTAGMRCRFDRNAGPLMDENVPHVDGRPVLGDAATQLFEQGPNPNVEMRPMQQGRIVWDPLSPFNMIVPPGVPHERYFPWECVVRPVLLDKVRQAYPATVGDLKEDTDIGSVYGWATDVGPDIRGPGGTGGGPRGRLRDHVWLFTYYEQPTGTFPKGRTVTLAGNGMRPLEIDLKLPYSSPDGRPRSGIAYFHWWRVTGRFWSRGLVDVMKDGQRQINKRRTQINEIIDRGMPAVFVEKNSAATKRTGVPVELIEIGPTERVPVPMAGIAPGQWMQGDVEALREDIEHATGIRAARLGENPSNVNTYSQLALINENDQGKRERIIFERKQSIGHLVEDSVYDMRTYWGPQRQLNLAGDDDQIDAAMFDATKIPTFFIVKVAKGAARPRSQAAELQKVEDIARYSLESQAPVPVKWFMDSLEAGQPLELPEAPADDQHEKALLENHLLMTSPQVPVEPDYYDPPQTHIPVHRSAQIQAKLAGLQPVVDAIERHIVMHEQLAQANAEQAALAAAGAAPGGMPGAADQGGPAAPAPGGEPAFPPFGPRLNRPI